MDPEIIWDLPDDPDGNVEHIAQHGITMDEAEDVLLNPGNKVVRSRTSGYPLTMGWTSTGRYICVIWEVVNDDPKMIRVRTAFEPDSG
jgi:uncharacterized DUF497 family protein